MTAQFDNDIPPPTRRTGPKGLYNFGEMQVGQSFSVPVSDAIDAGKKKAISLRVCAYQWAKRAKSSAKFSVAVRIENEFGMPDPNGELSVRVWRIA